LLETAGVAVLPGGAFGMDGRIRISYAVSKDKLASGIDKIREAL
jgi:aspartate aminotransferase